MAYLGRRDPLSGESAENGRTLSRTLLVPATAKAVESLCSRQFAATFRTFWQPRAIPAAAECLDEQYRVHHTAAEKIDRGDLIGKRGGLSRGHFEVAGDAALVTRDGQIQISLGCHDCRILCLSLA